MTSPSDRHDPGRGGGLWSAAPAVVLLAALLAVHSTGCATQTIRASRLVPGSGGPAAAPAGQPGPDLVRTALRDPDPQVRWRAVWALGESPDAREAVDAFRQALGAVEPGVRWQAALALSAFGRREALPLLHAGVRNPDRWRRWEAIHALGRVHDETTSRVLAPVLASSNAHDRAEAVLSLGLIGDDTALELLIGALEDPDPAVRWRACMALDRIDDPRSDPHLRELLGSEPDRRVLLYARRALAARYDSGPHSVSSGIGEIGSRVHE